MFNINLANKPGLQLDNKIDLDKNRSSVIFDDENKPEVILDKSKSSSWYLFVLISLFLFFAYLYFLLNQNKTSFFNKSYNINVLEIFNTLNNNQENIMIEDFFMDNSNFKVKLKTLDKDSFYNIFNLLSDSFDFNVMGSNKKNLFLINLNVDIDKSFSSKFSISELSKELTDFNPDIKKEVFNNKLILVLNKEDLYTFVDFLIKLNLIDNYMYSIQIIKNLSNNLELYQMIVE
tara:strand:- start:553 stop:1251 length:699 start_codon:yes stop_codon:yes gene_type:complete